MKLKWANIVIVLFTFVGCSQPTKSPSSNNAPVEVISPKYELTFSDIIFDSTLKDEHFRALHFNKNKAHIAGSLGSFIEIDLGTSQFKKANMTGSYHFRDIHSEKESIYLMSIQNPASLILIKKNVGVQSIINHDSLAFFDGIDFWKNGSGLLFGDPLNQFPYIVQLKPNYLFERVDSANLPKLVTGEAGFAASGTSLVCIGDGIGYIGWGGDEVRVFKTEDFGEHWIAQTTPMPKHQTGTGIYSMAFKDEKHGVAVGGNWEFPNCDSSKIYTDDGGKSWHLAQGIQGYRSCVTYVKENIYIATGTNGTDISHDGGRTWELLDTVGFNAIQFEHISGEKTVGMGVGNYGLIKRIEMKVK